MRRLASDSSGNTLAIVAAGLLPLLAMAGSGVDISRAYLAESRLQQACDAGVLVARKRLGSYVVVNNQVPQEVSDLGNRFFDINFKDGMYGTAGRQFRMYLEADYSVSGEADVSVPTSIMRVFGFDTIPVAVECEARLSFPNLDIMMALDTTGSMRHTNPGDSQSRIESLRAVIKNFYDQVEGSKSPQTRTRYGFVPFASNVNVGHLLDNKWIVNDWAYQSREVDGTEQVVKYKTQNQNWNHVSGSISGWSQVSSYAATWNTGSPPAGTEVDQTSSGSSGYYSCNGGQPGNSVSRTDTLNSTTKEAVTNPDGEKTTEYREQTENGTEYRTNRDGSTCKVEKREYSNFKQTYESITFPYYSAELKYRYKPISRDVSDWRTETGGCIEERSTYEIGDPATVDLSKALDLDIDLVPRNNDDTTKWRPRYPDAIYVRSLKSNGSGSISVPEVVTTDNYVDTGKWWFSACPAEARKLAPITKADLTTYLDSLTPYSATYHDIGMIWAGRLTSPTGLFANENKDQSANLPTSRNIIFLTDGQTETYDIAYGAYGIDALDQRRWSPSSTKSLDQVVEDRFSIACEEIKKRNIRIWIIAFGTTANPAMVSCAGDGRYFEASSADALQKAFSRIAQSLGDLRIAR